jgi:TonB family protein
MSTKILSGIDGARPWSGLLLLGLALVVPLSAQNRLYVQESGDDYHAVIKVSRGRSYIVDNGKLVAAKGQRFALKKVEEYLPVFIAVHDKEAAITAMTLGDTGTNTNSQFNFKARFESADLLEDVFLVLEMEISNVGKQLFVYEVGRLEPRAPKRFSVDLPSGQYLGAGQLEIHLFVGGFEVFNSEQPAAYREEMLDRMIAKRIASVQQAAPKPFYGSAPAYPPVLRKRHPRGDVVLTMRITPRGTVLDPVVESASDPLFGEAALDAVRQCRFLPRVQNGQAVEARISMPFTFELPKEALAEKG